MRTISSDTQLAVRIISFEVFESLYTSLSPLCISVG